MADILIRPTSKFIKLGYLLTVVVVIALAVAASKAGGPAWLPAVPLILLLWPAGRQIRRQFTKVTLREDKLRYETGFFSKTTRTIQLSKIQDVTVRQSLGQRMVGVGDLSIETAGESSRLTVASIDRPQTVADEIIEASKREAGKGQNA